MNILAGSVPYADDGADRVKLAVMSILNSQYGITEADLISAELCAVPAFEVRDVGLDRKPHRRLRPRRPRLRLRRAEGHLRHPRHA